MHQCGGLPNGVASDFNYRREEKDVLSSSANWSTASGQGLNALTVFLAPGIFNTKATDDDSVVVLRSNRFKSVSRNSMRSTATDGIAVSSANNFIVQILYSHLEPYGLLTTMTTAQKLEIFKLWLADNPTEVQYELAVPIPQNIDLPQLAYFGKDTVIECLNSVKPSKYDILD